MATQPLSSEPSTTAANAPAVVAAGRCHSLDAWRGWVMFLIVAEALQFCAISASHPGSAFWKFLCHHQSHADWTGCSLHDMIQPSFSFLVGAALAFSIAKRTAQGQSRGKMLTHALTRGLVLTLLGVALRTFNAGHANWTFEDTLSQIGMGYPFLFLLAWRPPRDQWIAFVAIVVGYWAAFAIYPVAADFNYPAVGVPADWPYLMHGFAAHWNKNSNLAWAFDTWFLNFFPRAHPFAFNDGGYATLSFIPTLATMLLGLIAGQVIRGPLPAWGKVRCFALAGVLGLGLGVFIDAAGICPIVKRIWTPSWVLFSGGWCFVYLTLFYALVDILGLRRWTFPFLVIGSNSIVAYCMETTSDTIFDRLGFEPSHVVSGPYAPLLGGALVLAGFWAILWVLHWRRIFIRI